ncbi:DUF6221 family protein [Actinomadura sp. DC4]|uniref:DUF6221 family protein n=1 Tax=Actinomadura sp. DC4 TaxID=3055069 RepID=UPI0025B26A90|nr:DUF6221 family protein [Actinomadura sp. DC4]MDN3356063.1 DUF6221 family protein [Actinomadura sp. DC4]
MSGQAWWYPAPRDGEAVPDYPPVYLGEINEDSIRLSFEQPRKDDRVTNLVDFLQARLGEDKLLALEAQDNDGYAEWDNPSTGVVQVAGGGLDGLVAAPGGAAIHMARHDPARALRQVEANRELVRLHGRMSVTPGHPYFNDAHLTKEPMTLCRSCEPETMWRRERSWPCRTLRTLALPYADHSDYREEWRP